MTLRYHWSIDHGRADCRGVVCLQTDVFAVVP
jgi:hypothetical protein